MISNNDFVVLANKGYEYVTWRCNMHPKCEGLHSGHYFRYDVYNGPENALSAATTDYIKRG
jgi:hypothetical protein